MPFAFYELNDNYDREIKEELKKLFPDHEGIDEMETKLYVFTHHS